jgi:circadian clock protein KaiC
VTLADVYTAGGEVLMGALRWEKESSERLAGEAAAAAAGLKGASLDAEAAVLEARLKSIRAELVAKQAEKSLLERNQVYRIQELSRRHDRMRELRGADGAMQESK